MYGIDVETTALTPEEGRLRLVQVSDGEETDVYDAFRQDAEVIRRAVEREEELATLRSLVACAASIDSHRDVRGLSIECG